MENSFNKKLNDIKDSTSERERILVAARDGILPEGAYAIRGVAYDGVRSTVTDSGARRTTPGDHALEPHFARVQNIPGRGPAWWRLVVDRVAYGFPMSDALVDELEAE